MTNKEEFYFRGGQIMGIGAFLEDIWKWVRLLKKQQREKCLRKQV